jgi:putative ABC transport system permease protein
MMEWFNILMARLRALFRRESVSQDIEEELRIHVEMETETNIERGMAPDEARAAALKSFGKVGRNIERGYDIRGGGWLETLWQDLRYGGRMLLKNPGFTLIAVLTLALGIGANTTIFSVVNAVLLQSLPYRDPDRLVLVSHFRLESRGYYAYDADFLEWRDKVKAFEQIAAYRSTTVDLTGDGEPERLSATLGSADLFVTLGIAPVLGRAFTPEEDVDGGPPVVILSDSLWQRRFGGDLHVVGQALTLGGRSRTVVGIMPPGFRFPVDSDLWLPLATNVTKALTGMENYGVTVIARLKPGLTPEVARAELPIILERRRQARPTRYTDAQVNVVGLSKSLVRNVQPALLMIFGAVAFVLLIACANVANLLLARSVARQKEMAIRAAIGAGRMRLVRQLMTESLLLSIVGGAAGLLAAKWSVSLFVAMSPAGIPRIEESGIDSHTLGFTCIVVALANLIVGVFPALNATKVDVNETLKAQSTARTGRTRQGGVGWMTPALMIAELALALVLLAGAGLMIKSFLRLLAVQKGFNPDGLLTLSLSPHRTKNPSAYIQESLDRVQALPGVQSASLTSFLPLTGSGTGAGQLYWPQKFVEGRPPFEKGKEPNVYVVCISPEYFKTMEMQMRAGRQFTSQDGVGAPQVVIINETLARGFFPNESPIGQRLWLWSSMATIVGVVGDTRHQSLDQDLLPQIYRSRMQNPGNEPGDLVVRVASDQNNPASLSNLAAAIRNQVRAMEPNVPVNQIFTMNERLSKSVAERRFLMLLLGVFAAVALVIATVGIYGVVSYTVSQRTREIGVRMALGAEPSSVLLMVVWQGMRLTLIGVVLGFAAALALTRVMKNMLFNVSTSDPATFTLIVLLLVSVALIAVYIPARRATKVDPLLALRHD